MLDANIRKNIIVSADDFGKSEIANRNILALAKSGKLDRVSVMSNGNFSAEEVEAIAASGVRLDIHLDLAEVPRREKKLKQGVLKRGILFLLKHIGSSEYKKDRVRKKWNAQIEKFEELFGRDPDGINSHQHIHFFGRYFLIALDLAKEHDIHYIRFAKKGLLGNSSNIRRVVNLLWKKEKKHFSDKGFDQPEYFVSLDWIKNMKYFLENLPEGKTELACHPERDDEMKIIETNF
jgi:predicted glycoside hydrolase/deacetylase ChbG (UPF0249 family)